MLSCPIVFGGSLIVDPEGLLLEEAVDLLHKPAKARAYAVVAVSSKTEEPKELACGPIPSARVQ